MSGRRRSSSGRGRGESSLGYLFGNSDDHDYYSDNQSSKAVQSVSGGGQTSLGYLFGTTSNQQQESSPPVSVCVPPPPPYGIDDEMIIKPEKPLPRHDLPSNNSSKTANYVYHKVDAQNSKDFLLTGRPSTRVTSVPGGDSSVGYLFGDHK